MSDFRSAWQAGQFRLDATFGERIEVHHFLAGGQILQGRPDPAFPVFAVVGILDLPSELLRPTGMVDSAKSELVVTTPSVDFDVAQFDALRPAPRKGSRLIATEQPGGPSFIVDEVKPDGLGRLICHLTRVSA